jgi:glycerol-3-phosphate acyltransferase PlsY
MFLAYLVGSVPTGLILGKLTHGIDIRQHGSGNLGATNVFRVLGKKLGAFALFLDVLKGLAPVVLFAPFVQSRPTEFTELLIGASAIAGHVFSIFVNFRGGKGVATALGVFLAIATKLTVILLVIGIAIILTTGYVSAASVTGALLLPFFLYVNHHSALVLFLGEIIAATVIVRHRSNIVRLLSGRELKLWGNRGAVSDERPIPTLGAGVGDSTSRTQ